MNWNMKTALVVGGIFLAVAIIVPLVWSAVGGWSCGGWGVVGPGMMGSSMGSWMFFAWLWLAILLVGLTVLIVWGVGRRTESK